MNYTAAFDLTGKVALITGASKGIGESMARFLAAYGARVVISSRKQADLDQLAADINQQGQGQVIGIAAHAGDLAQCQALIEKTVAWAGRLDILINNAATNPVFGPSLDCSAEAFDKIMDINLKAPFELSKMAYPYLKEHGGCVLNISSIAGLTPDPGLGMYSVSKAGLNMLTKVLAKEWGPDGIRVNALCPGLIKTKFSQALWENDKMLHHFTHRLPIPRMGTVEEVASLALYLVSPAAAYITGAIYSVDGGTTI